MRPSKPFNENNNMKPHLYRELVNELRDVAKEYAHTQQLRERIAHTLGRYVTPDSPLEKFNKKTKENDV